MGQRVRNEAGDELELVNNQWVPVGKAQAAPAAQESLLSPGSKFDQFGEAMAVSAGDQFTTAGRNIRDVYAMLRGDKGARDAIYDERVEADKIRARLHGESPVAATIGAMLPSAPLMLLSGGTAAPGLMGAARVGGQAAANSAAQGALLSESGDYLTDAAIGGGMSMGATAAGQIIGRVRAGRMAMQEAKALQGGAQGAVSSLNEAEKDILAGAQRAGLQLLPGQITNNPTFRKLEAGLARNPFMSKFFDDVEQGNKGVLNRLAARAMGQEADNVGPAVRMQAFADIGKQFDEVGKRLGRVDVDPMIEEVADMVRKESTAGMPRTQIKGIYEDLMEGRKGRIAAVGADEGRFITGEDMMSMRSTMSTKMRDAFASGNSERGQLYGEVLEKFDTAIENAAAQMGRKGGASAADTIELYGQARDRWNVWRALDRGGATTDGHLNIHSAAAKIGKGDKSGFLGRVGEDGETLFRQGTGNIGENPTGDLYDALRFYTSKIGKPAAPDTGGTVGAVTSWLNSGGTASSITKGVVGRLGALPLARAYANQSPLASQAMLFTQQALQGQPTGGGGFGLAQQAARMAQQAGGGLGGLGGF